MTTIQILCAVIAFQVATMLAIGWLFRRVRRERDVLINAVADYAANEAKTRAQRRQEQLFIQSEQDHNDYLALVVKHLAPGEPEAALRRAAHNGGIVAKSSEPYPLATFGGGPPMKIKEETSAQS